MGYWEAYRSRLERNEKALMRLARIVLSKDNEVEAYVHKDCLNKNRRIGSITFFKGNSENTIAFHEVPYRWSGCGYSESSNGNYNSGGENVSMPFTAQNVLDTFKPINRTDRYWDKESKLKWHSWLHKYEPQNDKNETPEK